MKRLILSSLIFVAATTVTVSSMPFAVRLTCFILAHFALFELLEFSFKKDYQTNLALPLVAFPLGVGFFLYFFCLIWTIVLDSIGLIGQGDTLLYFKPCFLILVDCSLLHLFDLILGKIIAQSGLDVKLGFALRNLAKKFDGAFGFSRLCKMWLDKKYGVSVTEEFGSSSAPTGYEIVLEVVDDSDKDETKTAKNKLRSLLIDFNRREGKDYNYINVWRWHSFPQLPVLFENLTEKQSKRISDALSLLLKRNQLDGKLKIGVRKSAKTFPDKIKIKLRSFTMLGTVFFPHYIEFVRKKDNEGNGTWWISTKSVSDFEEESQEVFDALAMVTDGMVWGKRNKKFYKFSDIQKGTVQWDDVEWSYEYVPRFFDIVIKEKPNGFFLSEEKYSGKRYYMIHVYSLAMLAFDDIFQQLEDEVVEKIKLAEERKEHEAEVSAAKLRRQKLMQKKTE